MEERPQPPVNLYPDWRTEYIQSPGPLNLKDMAERWGITLHHMYRMVERHDLHIERDKFWAELGKGSRKKLRKQLDDMLDWAVDEWEAMQKLVRQMREEGKVKTPNDVRAIGDMMQRVVHAILLVQGRATARIETVRHKSLYDDEAMTAVTKKKLHPENV